MYQPCTTIRDGGRPKRRDGLISGDDTSLVSILGHYDTVRALNLVLWLICPDPDGVAASVRFQFILSICQGDNLRKQRTVELLSAYSASHRIR